MKVNKVNVKDLKQYTEQGKKYLTILTAAGQKYNIGHLGLKNLTPEYIFSKNFRLELNTEVHLENRLF